jgi:hypothetical protein
MGRRFHSIICFIKDGTVFPLFYLTNPVLYTIIGKKDHFKIPASEVGFHGQSSLSEQLTLSNVTFARESSKSSLNFELTMPTTGYIITRFYWMMTTQSYPIPCT